MRSRTGTIVGVVLCALIVASLACGGGGGGGDDDDDPREEEPEEVDEPSAEAEEEEEPMAEAEEELEEEPLAEEEPEEEPPAAEEPEEEPPAAGAEPADEPPPPDVKAHLNYTPGGAEGGAPLPNCAFLPNPPSPGQWPAIVEYYGVLCLFGYPSATNLIIELHSPNGVIYAGDFQIEPLEPGGMSGTVTQVYPTHRESVGFASADADGLTDYQIQLGLTGLPSGQWTALVASESDGFSYETTFTPDDEPAVSALREGSADPFYDPFCDDFAPGEQVFILGTGFAPGDSLPLAVYHTPAQTVRDVFGVDLVYAETVTTTNAGEFWTAVTVEASDPPGTYYVVAVTDPAADQFFVGPGPLPTGCFKVP